MLAACWTEWRWLLPLLYGTATVTAVISTLLFYAFASCISNCPTMLAFPITLSLQLVTAVTAASTFLLARLSKPRCPGGGGGGSTAGASWHIYSKVSTIVSKIGVYPEFWEGWRQEMCLQLFQQLLCLSSLSTKLLLLPLPSLYFLWLCFPIPNSGGG